MKFAANKILGLAVGERSILIAEISTTDGRRQISRAGEFVYATGTTLQNPEGLGTALAAYLKAEGFSAKAAVFGIPAKWVLTKAKELPPVDPTLAADLIRLQVESEFSAELKDLVYDYGGQTHASLASHIMLAATPRRHVEQLTAVAEAARLEIRAITPTSMVLSALTGGVTDSLVLSITPSGTELAAQRAANPSLLRHVGSTMAVTASVAGEVRRASLMMPRNGSTGGNGSTNGHSHGQVIVWDDAGLDADARRAVTDALGPYARSGDFTVFGAGDLPDGMIAGAAAVALAVAGLTEGAIPVDFEHPRLAEPKKAAIPRYVILGAAAAVLVLICIIAAQIHLSHAESDLADMNVWNSKQKAGSPASRQDIAKAEIARDKVALQWHAGSARYLACLTDLQTAYPNPAPNKPGWPVVITEMSLDDTMHGEIHGHAKDRVSAEAYIKNIMISPHFSAVNSNDEMGNNNPETKDLPMTFNISFNYKPH